MRFPFWNTTTVPRRLFRPTMTGQEDGCSVVEMECAALAACCRKRGARFGQFLFTADSLANVHDYDVRDFGTRSHGKALQLGLEILRDYH